MSVHHSAAQTPAPRAAPHGAAVPATRWAAACALVRVRGLNWLQAHRHGVVAAALVGLGGFGITALAVAPLAAISAFGPDPAGLPSVTLREPLPLPTLAPQLEALADQEIELSRGTVSRSNDTIDSLLARLGVNDAGASAFLKRDATVTKVLGGRAGRLLRAQANAAGRLAELSVRFPAEAHLRRHTHFQRLVVRRDGAGYWRAQLGEAAYESELRLAAGTIRSSLFSATDEAEVPEAVAVQLAEIFSLEIDFHRELRRGDRFVVAYQVLSADGEAVPWNEGAGRVLAAEFVNAGRVHRALWFDGAGEAGAAGASSAPGGYYAPNGGSRSRAFLASPLEFSRVTSGFAMRRDPINQGWRAHLGVDYAAPPGTPVRAVGDGTVESAGWMNGYGQTVTVAHGSGRMTLYAHLSRIDVRGGEPVRQGQPVGAVGATGWATGPHLHFEFRVHGTHQDPAAVARLADAQPLSAQELARFMAWREGPLAQLDAGASLVAAPPAPTLVVATSASSR